jgi:cardiolipin synthase
MDHHLFGWPWKVILVTALVTIAATLLVLNWRGGEKKLETQLPRLYEADDGEFRRSLSALLGPALVDGNAIQTLVNGDRIFPSMLQAIREAKTTVTFETYIYWSGDIGKAFVDALSDRAKSGVKVHVLLDWVGSMKMDDGLLQEMKRAGVEIERFHEPHWSNWGKMNNRTHRKLLVVDGRIGFTGGVGIADHWQGDARTKDEWRDTHYRVEGPAVAQMQSVFLDNWMRATSRVLHGEHYFPALRPVGSHTAQMFSSSPSGGSESMQLMYLLAVTAARKTINLTNAYFVPDELTLKTLKSAADRGVVVRILTPNAHIDSETVRKASRSTWGPLLEAGVQIAEYQPTMLHVKGLVVDNFFTSVGSTNFDSRSFRLNDEANLNVLNAAFAAEQNEIFQRDWAKAQRITLEAWRERPMTERAWELAARLLRSQL